MNAKIYQLLNTPTFLLTKMAYHLVALLQSMDLLCFGGHPGICSSPFGDTVAELCELEELASIARPVAKAFLPHAVLISASADISARVVVDSRLPKKNKIAIKISGRDGDWGSMRALR